MNESRDAAVEAWLDALEARHLADLRVPEVTRALRALSSAYVERRHTVERGATLNSAGKRAAFALFYGPLHFMALTRAVRAVTGDATQPALIVDLGCGTGVAGAAWAMAADARPMVIGFDRHRWAVDEARWTYRQFGLSGRARLTDLSRVPPLPARAAIVAAYVLNEMPESSRQRLEDRLLEAAGSGSRVLIAEPIARAITPWWSATAERVIAAGGRSDEWRFPVDLPAKLQRFDRASGLNHRELTLRTLYLPG